MNYQVLSVKCIFSEQRAYKNQYLLLTLNGEKQDAWVLVKYTNASCFSKYLCSINECTQISTCYKNQYLLWAKGGNDDIKEVKTNKRIIQTTNYLYKHAGPKVDLWKHGEQDIHKC